MAHAPRLPPATHAATVPPGTVIEIDGSLLEGGGQILRNASALSAILQLPIRVNKIRAGRSKPGGCVLPACSASPVALHTFQDRPERMEGGKGGREGERKVPIYPSHAAAACVQACVLSTWQACSFLQPSAAGRCRAVTSAHRALVCNPASWCAATN
jgi:hypothetical protein